MPAARTTGKTFKTLAKLLAAKPTRPPNWLSRLTAAQRSELEAIREGVKSGEILVPYRDIAAAVATDMGLAISVDQLRRFFRGEVS